MGREREPDANGALALSLLAARQDWTPTLWRTSGLGRIGHPHRGHIGGTSGATSWQPVDNCHPHPRWYRFGAPVWGTGLDTRTLAHLGTPWLHTLAHTFAGPSLARSFGLWTACTSTTAPPKHPRLPYETGGGGVKSNCRASLSERRVSAYGVPPAPCSADDAGSTSSCSPPSVGTWTTSPPWPPGIAPGIAFGASFDDGLTLQRFSTPARLLTK